jgi:hypothetical protein
MTPPTERAEANRIGVLRVRGAGDSTGARLALSAVLDRVDLRPPGLPPAAVLIVRQMGDPLPGHVAPRPLMRGPDPAWERAARDQLARFYRRAARPARGTVAADADAVLFSDEAELLASLALDLAGGRVGDRWWWRSFGGSSRLASPSGLAVLLRDRAAWVPAALAELVRRDRAADIVRRLAADEALVVLTAVARAHRVTALVGALTDAPQPPPVTAPTAAAKASWQGSDDRPQATAGDITDATAAISLATAKPAPPWSSWLPPLAAARDLDRAQAALLGIALVLHHRPDAARSTTFTLRLRRWWQGEARADTRSGPAAAPPRAVQPPVPHSPGAAQSRHRPDVEANRIAPVADPISAAPVPSASPPIAPVAPADRPRVATQRKAPSPTDGPPTAAEEPPAAFVADDHAPREAPSPTPDAVPPAPDTSAAHEAAIAAAAIKKPSEAAPVLIAGTDGSLAANTSVSSPELGQSEWSLVLENGVETGLGGVLFLINAMCALDLPECFESGWRIASRVGAWGLLEGLGRALLGSDPVYADDPIWPALAALSGRGADEPLGSGVPRRTSYRLPLAWTEQLPTEASAPAAWAARGRRLSLWSRGNFMLSEVPLGAGSAAVVAQREAARFGARAAPRRRHFADTPLGTTLPNVNPGFSRWLSLVLPFIRLRLERALGIDPDIETLRSTLLARPGRLYVTSTHVDLVMGLDSVSLPVRFAGLDRSPGWLGEFGRVILFHFE